MMLSNATADLVDTIVNCGLRPIPYSGRQLYGQDCVACVVSRGSDMDGLPKESAHLDNMGTGAGYVLYWPRAEWTAGVQEYVDTIDDSSGKAE
jgi:hypothetical protein